MQLFPSYTFGKSRDRPFAEGTHSYSFEHEAPSQRQASCHDCNSCQYSPENWRWLSMQLLMTLGRGCTPDAFHIHVHLEWMEGMKEHSWWNWVMENGRSKFMIFNGQGLDAILVLFYVRKRGAGVFIFMRRVLHESVLLLRRAVSDFQ